MGFLNRIMATIEGARNGWFSYDARYLVPYRDMPYGDHAMRISRYNVAESYYYNTIYDRLGSLAASLKEDEKLYKFIRGISNPVKQENNLIVSYTYKGTIDTVTLKGGSIPLRYENAQLEPALKQVVKWSNLDQQLATYVKDAALLGDAAWWIVDDPLRQRVRMELVDPGRIKHIERDEVGNVKAVVIEYLRQEEDDVERYQAGRTGIFSLASTKMYTFTLIATSESFKTFKDGKPHAFYSNTRGQLTPEWDNPYGFVPLKMAYYALGKDGWGQNSFFGTVRRQIDELNDQASIINDSVRNVVVPRLVATGMTAAQRTVTERDEKDGITIIYLPSDSATLNSLDIQLDITGASANRAVLVSELVKNMPVLALQQIRDIGGNLSGVAIQNMFGDATSQIENVRKNLNPALCAAMQMAVTIGGIQGYEGFQGFDADSFDSGDMELSIAPTPVIEDQLSRGEKLDKLISIAKLPSGTKRKALNEMGYSEDDVETIISEDKTEAEEAVRNAVRGVAEAAFDDDEDVPDDEDELDDGEDTEKEEASAKVAA